MIVKENSKDTTVNMKNFLDLKKGDCLSLLPSILDDSVDLVCADMPYGTTKCKWNTPINLELLWVELKRITKDNAPIILFAQTPFDKILGVSNLPMLRYEWILEKTSATGFLNANKMPMKAHENILVFYKKLPTYNPQKTTGHSAVNSYTKRHGDGECYGKTVKVSGGGATDRFPRSVLKFSSDKQKSKLHPTQKPLALIEYLIKTYSNKGDHVLDFCMGSGTTGVAAVKLERCFTGIELNDDYYKITKKRINTIHDNSQKNKCELLI